MRPQCRLFGIELPILYSFRRCPFAIRARMALAVAGVRVELREVSLKAKPAEMLAASPKGTVPVLVLPDDQVIDESLDIMRWALAGNDPQGWLDHDRQDAAELIAANDGPFKQALDKTKYPNRFDGADSEGGRGQALALLKPLDQQLAIQNYLLANCASLADVALFPFVRQFAQIDRARFEREGLPHLARWLADWEASLLFATVMFRTANWAAGDKAMIWP